MSETKIEYKDLVFMGREFKKKGKGTYGEWKLFSAKFQSDEEPDKTLKFSAFAGPRKGKCITELNEGDTYNVGFTSEDKTFDGDNGPVEYTARTVKFIGDDSEEKEEETDNQPQPNKPTEDGGETSSPSSSSSPDLLSKKVEEQPKNAIQLGTDEELLLNQLKGLDQTNVTETAFKETLVNRIPSCEVVRQNALWKYYTENTLKE